MMTQEEKQLFLKEFVKDERVINELFLYTKNKFIQKNDDYNLLYENYINTWEEYFQESKERGVFETLKKYIVQLQFPVQKGISKTKEYIDSTLRGKEKISCFGLMLNEPELIKLDIYQNKMVGKVPIIIVPNNNDFNIIVSALSNRNEPQEVSKSMGASFINGINNWDRIHRLKEDWLKNNLGGNWGQYFKEHILSKPYLFKDKLIILSTKVYSGVEGKSIGISKSIWKSSSLRIRREHECTHLFTLKYYGSIANNMHDEIIADYAGIIEVQGRFNKEWFLHFLGLENYPTYRKGGRLENYRGQEKLSKEAFDGLKKIIKNIADTISVFDNELGEVRSFSDQLNRIKSICEVDLITMASIKGTQRLIEKYNTKHMISV